METVEIEESDTDRSTNIITEMKHLTDRRNYITVKIKTDSTERNFIVDTGPPVKKNLSDKELTEGKKIIPVTKKRTLLKTKLKSP